MTQPSPLIMLCTDKGLNGASTVTVLNGLSYGMARLLDSFVQKMTKLELCEFIILFKYLLLIGF